MGRGFQAGFESASEQAQLRFVIDVTHMVEHVAGVVEHTEANGLAGPFRFTGDDDAVAGNAEHVELCFGLSAPLFGSWGWDGPHQAPTHSTADQVLRLHLVENPRAANLLECRLGQDVVEGGPFYLGIGSGKVGGVTLRAYWTARSH